MIEMQQIAASCCGRNMEYCGGATPSQCDGAYAKFHVWSYMFFICNANVGDPSANGCTDTCKPVFESFYSRCTDMIAHDPNRNEYVAFHGMCHPASDDTSEVLWSDDFESGLGKWRGQTNANAPETAVIDDDPHRARLHCNHRRHTLHAGRI